MREAPVQHPPPLRLARIAYPVTALGPGRRLALWVSGCGLDCAGCISPELRDPNAGKSITVERLARHILRIAQPLNGLTVSGGEPFEQAAALASLWHRLLAERPDWDLIAFSGYTQRQLLRRGDAQALLECVDLLAAGPYRRDRPGDHPLLASANQRLHARSAKGDALLLPSAQARPGARNLGLIGAGTGWLIGLPAAAERSQD